MRLRTTTALPSLALALAACASAQLPEDDLGDAEVSIRAAAGTLPADAECARVEATHLSDFQVTVAQGPLDGMTFKARTGDYRISATAYPAPCDTEPPAPPWIADAMPTTLISGTNIVTVKFKKKVDVVIDPVFEDDTPLEIRAGSLVATGRNAEDASEGFGLNAWTVSQLALPPPGGGGGETVLFSVEGTGLPYAPRGMARLADGRFLFQVSETTQPFVMTDAGGANAESVTVVYAPGMVQWDYSDGLSAYGGTTLIRTGWLNAPQGCSADGPDCIQAGLDVISLTGLPDGSTLATVESQILIPAPYNQEYPVGVVGALGGPTNIVVTTLPGGVDGGKSRFLGLDGTGALTAGPVLIQGDYEGLLDTHDGRMMAIEYSGQLASFDAADLTRRPAEDLSYAIGPDLTRVVGLAWDAASSRLVALSLRKVAFIDAAFAGPAVDTGISLPPEGTDPNSPVGYIEPRGLEVLPGNEVGVMDRVPPLLAGTGRVPRLDRFSLATGSFLGSTLLTGAPLPVRVRSLAYIGARNQYAVTLQRPGGGIDATISAVVFVHDTSGALVAELHLEQFGLTQIASVNYLPATQELLLLATDDTGTQRLLVTDLDGNPRRSRAVPAGTPLFELAPIGGGPFAGDYGASIVEPSQYLRVAPF